jgi:hypothetical protein
VAELVAFAQQTAARRQGLGRHWSGNVVLTGHNDAAEAVSYVHFLQIDADIKERRMTISGVHRGRFVRTPESWRFASRTVVADI